MRAVVEALIVINVVLVLVFVSVMSHPAKRLKVLVDDRLAEVNGPILYRIEEVLNEHRRGMYELSKRVDGCECCATDAGDGTGAGAMVAAYAQ